MRYDWEWVWGDQPGQGMRGGESFKTKSKALWHGQRTRAEMIRRDTESLQRGGTGNPLRDIIRPKGVLTVIESESDMVIWY